MSQRNDTPWERWSRDPRQLRHLTQEELARAFVIRFERTVTNDRLVPIDGVLHELPRGLAPGGRRRRKVLITQRLLEGTYHVQCGDHLVRIHPVDVTLNARSARDRRGSSADEETRPPPEKTAADLAFEHDLSPLVDEDGSALVPDDDPSQEMTS